MTTCSNKTGVRSSKKRSPKPKEYSGKGKLKACGSDDYDPSISESNDSNSSDAYSSQASDEESISHKPSKAKGTKSSEINFTSDKEDSVPTLKNGLEGSNTESPSKNKDVKIKTGSVQWLVQMICECSFLSLYLSFLEPRCDH